MTVEPNVGSRPVPDPTALTTAALYREIAQLRDLFESKMTTIDTKMTGHFHIDAQRFAKIDEEFRTIESQRVEQKRDTQDALTAALTAQKEAVAKQDEANQKAITKAEITTGETLKKLEQLINVKTDGLRDRIDDVKNTANGTVNRRVGATENRSATFAVIGVIGTVIVALFTILGFALAHMP
jgi:hypothetical protein